ncbi:hypothetical protein Halru_1768 [Halovivax ruber XH-70]|uniref:Hsp20/alpha crystallin family protein n=1 Tax=Halovivax ruber (strain DSM 18193 / JCM 13892 / XH-70) TaxID=797302 RepID=L0IEJ4_HALRX|nr:hypothetical protein [Halovivax ruber]AGB16367.1 hypothetical protein Halru_1768 [Halovivax ruber XH-70]
MTIADTADAQSAMVRTYEYDDSSVVVADLADASAEPAVDVVDGTAIVVLDGRQHEIDLPQEGTVADTFMKNGVLSIELEGTR